MCWRAAASFMMSWPWPTRISSSMHSSASKHLVAADVDVDIGHAASGFADAERQRQHVLEVAGSALECNRSTGAHIGALGIAAARSICMQNVGCELAPSGEGLTCQMQRKVTRLCCMLHSALRDVESLTL